jgi:hypothetical protein
MCQHLSRRMKRSTEKAFPESSVEAFLRERGAGPRAQQAQCPRGAVPSAQLVVDTIVRGSSSFVINADSCIVKVQGVIYFTLTCRISPPHLTSSGRYSF